jgi:linoleoyl-CoA desaturase
MAKDRAGIDAQINQRFAREVKARVNAYFEDNGLSRHANAAMVAKTVTLVTLYFGAYALILGSSLSWPWLWLLCLAMGVGMAGIGFSVIHDALHGAYAASPWVNRLIGYLFEALGANGYIWKIKHNGVHHTYPNIKGYDEDLEALPLIRLSPHTPHRPIHRWQHVFAPLTYSLTTINWVLVGDYEIFFRRDVGPYRDRKHPRSQWISLLLAKTLYYLAMIVAPLLLLDITWWQFLIGFLTLHLSAGLILAAVFQPAHLVEPTEHHGPDGASALKTAWMLHQMRTTCNFAPGNRLLSWYVGGLNYQIEHHLFPRICHVHYRHLSPIVEQVARKHGVPYHSYPTLWQAIRSHYRMLKRLGDPGGQPASAVARAGTVAGSSVPGAPLA